MLINKKIKNFCISSVLIFFSFSLPLGAVNYWGDGIFADFGFSSKGSYPSSTPYEGILGIRKTMDKAVLFTGFCIDDFGFTVAASTQVIPLRINVFSLGAKYLTNFTRSFTHGDRPDLITWGNAFFITTSFTLGRDKNNPFVIDMNVGLNGQYSFLKLSTSTLSLLDTSISIELQLTKRFLNRHEIMFRWTNFDTFLFEDYINFWWQLGYSFDITQDFALGGLAELVYTDQVILSGTISGIQAKIFGVYKL